MILLNSRYRFVIRNVPLQGHHNTILIFLNLNQSNKSLKSIKQFLFPFYVILVVKCRAPKCFLPPAFCGGRFRLYCIGIIVSNYVYFYVLLPLHEMKYWIDVFTSSLLLYLKFVHPFQPELLLSAFNTLVIRFYCY